MAWKGRLGLIIVYQPGPLNVIIKNSPKQGLCHYSWYELHSTFVLMEWQKVK